MFEPWSLCLSPLLVMAQAPVAADGRVERVDYLADVAPILSARCYECHGSERQKAGLRLDLRAAALAGSRFGKTPVLVPGSSASSVLFERLVPEFEEDRMPPEGPALTPAEIAILRRWVDEGAVWPRTDEVAGESAGWVHWAYAPPVRPTVPDDVAHAIDHFVGEELARAGLEPAPEAPRPELLRRVTLALTGLPPTLDEVEAFLVDEDEGAYSRVVERLLAEPAYGEHQARAWLDIARYADTKGFEKDARRSIWRYRDWVIDAFNANMPFDQFTIEQLAGDLLPGARPEQVLATAFHRNTLANDEGGTDDEEFRVEAVVDRVNTTLEAWMGTTMACAQCHDHRYDPFTQREYYELFAFFNQTEDADRPDDSPTLAVPSPRELAAIAPLAAQIVEIQAENDVPYREKVIRRRRWEERTRALSAAHARATSSWSPWSVSGPYPAESLASAFATAFPPEMEAPDQGPTPAPEWVEAPGYEDGVVHTDLQGDTCAHYLRRTVTLSEPLRTTLSLGSDDTLTIWVNGERVLAKEVARGAAPDQERVAVDLVEGPNTILMKVCNGGGPSGFYFRSLGDGLPDDVRAALAAESRNAEQERAVLRHHKEVAPERAGQRAHIETLRARIEELRSPPTPIMRELPPGSRRQTHVHRRGSFLSPGPEVQPDVPAVFGKFDETRASDGGDPGADEDHERRRDRLGFARWLVARDNPLSARVTVNRYWEQLFGAGLVVSLEDFGTRSDPPSHPELLDWLAVGFMESGWDVKRLLRTLVTSRSYMQSSRVTPQLLERDPTNRLLARGPRLRLDAEVIRDQALAVSGLLSPKMYGPSVMPPQPDGLWQVIYSGDSWTTSTGEDRYRRALYTFWRRSTPYPSLTAFDAPSREFCSVRRLRTNTPLQALVTLNDPVFVEAAQALARRVLVEGGEDPSSRARFAFRTCLAREPSTVELERLVELTRSEYAHYAESLGDAESLVTGEQGEMPPGTDLAELAAWTVTANVLLNLDEFLTRG